jgi:NAD(P)-dependent dehydrogenase (short-subunit alcohol dehydrogenase family)
LPLLSSLRDFVGEGARGTSSTVKLMGKTLSGKIALVTGANGGLGKSVTQALLDAGATVVGLSRKIEQSEFSGPNFFAVPADISSGPSAKKMVDEIVARHKRIDILAHLVGGFAGGSRIDETDEATFQQMFEVNLNAAFYLLRAVIPYMRQARSGRIIAIGSRAAEDPGPGVGAYSASKAAVVSLIETVARENKDLGITANSILPGTMDTPVNRKAMPKADFSTWVRTESVASLILWLATESDVTGAVIPVYGKGL